LPQGRGRHEHFRGPYYKRDGHRVGADALARDAAGGVGGVLGLRLIAGAARIVIIGRGGG